MPVSKELSKYKVDLVVMQKVRWGRGGTEPADVHTCSYGLACKTDNLTDICYPIV
jgi:hypothetical protein